MITSSIFKRLLVAGAMIFSAGAFADQAPLRVKPDVHAEQVLSASADAPRECEAQQSAVLDEGPQLAGLQLAAVMPPATPMCNFLAKCCGGGTDGASKCCVGYLKNCGGKEVP
jgi:hypothetical protein